MTRRPDAHDARVLDAVIFDLGGVLALNGRPADAASRFPGVDPDVVAAAIMGPFGQDTDHPWHRIERGEITMAEYQVLAREHLAALRPPPEPAATGPATTVPAPNEPAATDPAAANPPATNGPGPASFRFLVNPAMMALAADLRSAGVKTAILTNNARELRPTWWDAADWPALFDDIVDSHEVGIRKPNPAIYRLALERLRVTAGRTAFLDDIAPNATAAAAVGMTGIHVVGDGAAAIATVRRLAGLD